MNENKNMYLIPVNVSADFEFFRGIGVKQIRLIIFVLIISSVVCYLCSQIKKTIYIEPDTTSYTLEEIKESKLMELNEDGLIEQEVPVLNMLVRIFIVLVPTVFAWGAAQKMPDTNKSMIDELRDRRNYFKSQNKYLYVYNSGGATNEK